MQPEFYHARIDKLPVYRTSHSGYEYFYTPGYVTRISLDEAVCFEGELRSRRTGPIGASLISAAEEAARKHKELMECRFQPLCLTLYPNQTCNLNCIYCFANPNHDKKKHLSLKAITAAAILVADNCSKKRIPFTVVVQGGGEPTLTFDLLKDIMNISQKIADLNGIPLFSYISTNGVMLEEQARWIANHFNLIGLSCDGPQWIQDRNRPTKGAFSSTPIIEQTAALFREDGKKFHVRVTLMPGDISSMPSIAAYLCETLHPDLIHIEPVYLGGRAGENFLIRSEETIPFVESFLVARKIAALHQCQWILSGSQPNQIHSSYCHPFRQVLNLIPGDVATLCFKCVDQITLESNHLDIGKYHIDSDEFQLNSHKLFDFYQNHRIPRQCEDCFLSLQCTHGCPDVCLAFGENYNSPMCAIYKNLATRTIMSQIIDKAAAAPGESVWGIPIEINGW